MTPNLQSPRASGGRSLFTTTRWSLVLTAGDEAAPAKEAALEELFSSYWKPLYAALRRMDTTLTPEDAEDCLQAFFADFYERVALKKVDPAKGKFRSFLCASLKHFRANERVRDHAQKRGGRFQFVSWENAALEELIQDAALTGLSPDKLLERTWALTLVERALARLAREQTEAGKAEQFQALQVYLTGDRGTVPYAETAARLGLNESAAKMAVKRLRRGFGECLRDEVAQTVTRPEEIDEEIRALFSSLKL